MSLRYAKPRPEMSSRAPVQAREGAGRSRWVRIGMSGLDLDVDARRNVELLQRFHRLGTRSRDVDQALVDPDLELLTRLLVHVRAAEDRVDRLLRGQRHRARGQGTGATRRTHDLARRLIEHGVVVGLQLDADLL